MYSKVIIDGLTYLPRDEVAYIESLEKDVTVTRKFDGSDIIMWKELPEWIGIPRFLYGNMRSQLAGVVSPNDNRSEGSPIRFDFTSELRPDQLPVIQDFQSRLRSPSSPTGFLFDAPAAFGKTVCLLKMTEMLGRTTLVVVPRSNLVEQWMERILEHTSLTRERVGFAKGGTAWWEGKAIVVGLVHTLALDKFGKEFKRYFGTVVFDEVDRSVPPETFAPVAGMFPAKYRIGASATMKRVDGLDRVFHAHMGEAFISGRGGQVMLPKVLMVHFNKSSGHVYTGSARLNRRGMLISRLSENKIRNERLCHYVKLIYNSGRRVLVLSDRIAQLKIMQSILSRKFKIPEGAMGLYISKMKKGEKDRVASDCKIILATYGMFAIGSDIPDLSGLVYATPQAETRQSKGRIERFADKKEPVIVDFVDTAYSDAVGWAFKRKKMYLSEGSVIKNIGGR